MEAFLKEAETRQATGLLLCGDLFDTYEDYVAGEARLLEALKAFSGFVAIAWGNHEWLRKGARPAPREGSLGERVRVFASERLDFWEPVEGVELLGKSHSEALVDLRGGKVPRKVSGKVRFFLGHGTLIAPGFPVFDEEEGGAVFSVGLFEEMGCDAVALGHIHRRPEPIQGESGTVIAYAGSSRVWRRTEQGPRGFLQWDLQQGAEVFPEFVALERAGELKTLRLWIDGSETGEQVEARLLQEVQAVGCAPFDQVEIEAEGWVVSEDQWLDYEREMTRLLESKVAKVRWNREGVLVFDQMSEQPAFSRFLKKWETLADPSNSDWRQARILGLRWIRDAVEGRLS